MLKRLLEQIFWLAVCIYHEARGESDRGKVAVGHAILNRVEKRDKSIKDIVLQPWQFSFANINVIEGKPLPPIKDYQALIDCQHNAFVCLIERLEGKDLNGANHYFNDSLVTPSWAKNMKFIDQIGNHVFFKG